MSQKYLTTKDLITHKQAHLIMLVLKYGRMSLMILKVIFGR